MEMFFSPFFIFLIVEYGVAVKSSPIVDEPNFFLSKGSNGLSSRLTFTALSFIARP